MGLKAFTFSRNNKKFSIKVKKCGFFGMLSGLMFKTRNTSPLLFNVRIPTAIHSLFVFFPFVAIWLDKNNRVVEMKKVSPFQFHILPKKHFAQLLEIPINSKNFRILGPIKLA